MIKAVFFDLDGTLVEFKLDVYHSKIEVLKLIKSIVPNIEGLDETKSYYMMLDKVRTSVDEQTYMKIRASIYDLLDGFEEEAARQTKLREGALDVIKKFKSSGKKIALLTNSGRKAVLFVLRRFGIEDYFDTVLTRNELRFMKPSPEGIYHLLDFFKLQPNECVTVGDGLIDIVPSKIVGLKTIVIAGGYGPLERLIQEKPDHIIYNLNDLISLLD